MTAFPGFAVSAVPALHQDFIRQLARRFAVPLIRPDRLSAPMTVRFRYRHLSPTPLGSGRGRGPTLPRGCYPLRVGSLRGTATFPSLLPATAFGVVVFPSGLQVFAAS